MYYRPAFVRAVFGTGTPVVLIIENGRPLSLGWLADKMPAIIQAWLPGEDVVQLYINDVFASVARPVRELRGFGRIALEPGESMTVEFKLPVEALGFCDKDMRFAIEPGIFTVMVGRSWRV